MAYVVLDPTLSGSAPNYTMLNAAMSAPIGYAAQQKNPYQDYVDSLSKQYAEAKASNENRYADALGVYGRDVRGQMTPVMMSDVNGRPVQAFGGMGYGPGLESYYDAYGRPLERYDSEGKLITNLEAPKFGGYGMAGRQVDAGMASRGIYNTLSAALNRVKENQREKFAADTTTYENQVRQREMDRQALDRNRAATADIITSRQDPYPDLEGAKQMAAKYGAGDAGGLVAGGGGGMGYGGSPFVNPASFGYGLGNFQSNLYTTPKGPRQLSDVQYANRMLGAMAIRNKQAEYQARVARTARQATANASGWHGAW